MKFGIESIAGRYGGLTKAMTTKEGNEGSCPYCSVEGNGEVKCLVKDKKVFHGDWGT